MLYNNCRLIPFQAEPETPKKATGSSPRTRNVNVKTEITTPPRRGRSRSIVEEADHEDAEEEEAVETPTRRGRR